MSERRRKTDVISEGVDESDYSLESHYPLSHKAESSDSKRIRRILPMGMRVLVRIRKEGNQTDAGLYLPEGAKQNMQESLLAEVLEVASATDQHSDEETNVSGIPMGALVLIPKTAGVRVPWDEEKRLVDTKDILAVVSEVSLS